jgi:peptidoglycan hydrolase CwlO-like protein
MPIPWENVGALLAAFVVALGKSCYSGHVRETIIDPFLDKQRTAEDAHATIPEVRDTVTRVESKLDDVDEKVEEVQSNQQEVKKTIAYLHRNEMQDHPLVRQRLGVKSGDDILDND